MSTFSTIEFGDYLTVTDEGGGTIRVDGCPPGGVGGLQFNSGTYGPNNVGDWLHVEVTGTDSDGGSAKFVDSGGGGFNFFTSGFGANDGGVYIESDSSGSGFPVALGILASQASGSGSPKGLDIESDTTAGTGTATGAYMNADGNDTGGAVALHAGAAVLSGSGAGSIIGITTTGDGAASGLSGVAYGIIATGQNRGSGKAIGADLYGISANSGTGDVIGARITAKQNAGGAGTMYGMQVFIGTTKVFQIDADGSLHGLTGQSLTFDL